MGKTISIWSVAAIPLRAFFAVLSADAGATPWEKSEWLSVPEAPVFDEIVQEDSRAAPGTSWFASEVTNAAAVVSARWTVTGLGVFEAYVNGRPVGKDFLKPGFTHPAKTRYAFSYDVTPLLDTAAGAVNVLAAEVSAGWWRDKIVSPSERRGFVGRKSAFRGILELTYADGTAQTVGTDTRRWRCGIAGAVKAAAIFDGEDYDARVPNPVRGEGLVSIPETNDEFGGEILPTAGAEVTLREDLVLSPVKAYVWKGVTGASSNAWGTATVVRRYAADDRYVLGPGETLVLDFGQNAAAVPRFTFAGEPGTVLTVRPAEMLNDGNGLKSRGCDGPEGSVYRISLREGYENARLVTYTFAGGTADYQPRFTYFGYRYLSLTATGRVTFGKVRSVPVSSITAERECGQFTTGNADVNKLVSNVLWSQRSNYLSVPTDCPQRNERLGWTADTQVFCGTASYNADVYAFLRKWMRDMRDGQDANGSFVSVAPQAQYGDYPDRLGWSDAGIIVPYVMWRQYGDATIVKENWAAMTRHLARVSETKGATLPGGSQWADWLSFEKYQPANAPWRLDPPKEALEYWDFLGACYWLWDARMMAEMAQALGDTAAAAAHARTAEDALVHLRRRFVAADGLLSPTFRDLQTACLFALKLGLLEHPESVAATKEILRQGIRAHGGCLQTGFLGTSILMETLVEQGMTDVAYALLLNHRFPGWLYSVDQGATTVWERWNSYTRKDGFGYMGMNSFNHYAYGAVVGWLYRHVAGIAADPKAPGFANILLAPKPDRRLGYASAVFRSPRGTVASAWRYEGDLWTWTFTVPEGATATVTVPCEAPVPYGPGTHTVTRRLDPPRHASVRDAVRAAVAAGEGTCVIRGEHLVDAPVELPSDFTLVLDGARLTLAPEAFCNVFRADGVTNVTICGRNGAVVSGGVYNGLHEKIASRLGRPSIYVNNLLLFSNVRGFRVEGIRFEEARWWALNFIACSQGVIRNVDFRANHTSVFPDGSTLDTVSRLNYPAIKVKNADGIDLRHGCHHILVENVTGFTEDDSVAVTCLPGPGREEQLAPKGTPWEISDITIRNVKTASMCSNVRLLAQGGGRLRRITVDGVTDMSDGHTYMTGRGEASVNVGDAHLYRKLQSRPEEVTDITIRNVKSRAQVGVFLRGGIGSVTVDNVTGFDGCPVPVADRRISAK